MSLNKGAQIYKGVVVSFWASLSPTLSVCNSMMYSNLHVYVCEVCDDQANKCLRQGIWIKNRPRCVSKEA